MSTQEHAESFILFITGISGSGKTTLYESLKADESLADIEFHDVDEHGVPAVGRGPWRSFRVEELLFEAGERLEKGVSTIICGITKPHEVIESRYYLATHNVHYVLLDIELKTFEERMRERLRDQEKTGTFDEVFNPDAYQELLLGTKRLKRILKNSIINQKNGHLLDADQLNKETVHQQVLAIIKQLT